MDGHGEALQGSNDEAPRGEMEKALVPIAEVTKAMTLQASQATEPREEAPEPGPILLEVPSALPSLGASNSAKLERVPTSHASLVAMEVQHSSSTPAGPSGGTAPLPEIVEASVTMPPNTSVIRNAGLAKTLLLDFILPSRDRMERSECTMGKTITRIFPQLLAISLP